MAENTHEIIHRDFMRWIHGIYKSALEAEIGINRSYQHAKQSVANNTDGVKNDVSGAKQRLADAQKALTEIQRVKDIYWTVVAVVELILHHGISEERRAKLPPSITELFDAITTD